MSFKGFNTSTLWTGLAVLNTFFSADNVPG